MNQGSKDTAGQIEEQELEVADRVLDVIAKDSQKKHVANEVPDVAVEKHIRDQSVGLWNSD